MYTKTFTLFAFLVSMTLSGFNLLAQETQKLLTYYLPNEQYDASILTPEAYFGYNVGEWHLSPQQVVSYIQYLGQASPRFSVDVYAKSYEERPVVLATISSEANHSKMEQIQANHLALTQPDQANNISIEEQPVVVWMGYSVHGNEPSGTNASVLFAYYLAASQSTQVNQWLSDAVVLFDPIINPDGANRFSTHVNAFRSIQDVSDPNTIELNEGWLSGRTNHYWFDLNRDWLLQQHPESRGRIEKFQQWKPNVLTDHHEMGSNSSFFFMPGIPSRTHPLTPAKNQELTKLIGNYHAEQLDGIGSLYYTEESFDDFYYGKGSTYPDMFGGVGILFEQGSSRGHVRDTDNGLLSFPFTIRNQVATSFSTLKASVEMKNDLLSYFKDFYAQMADEANKAQTQAYLLGDSYDQTRSTALLDVLMQHGVKIRTLTEDVTISGDTFKANAAYVLLTKENHPRFLEAAFEERTTFTDSTFYDVSAWSLQHAFNIPLARLTAKQVKSMEYGKLLTELPSKTAKLVEDKTISTPVGFIFSWNDFDAAKVLLRLQRAGMKVKIATENLELPTPEGLLSFERGSVFVPFVMQGMKRQDYLDHLKQAIKGTNVIAYQALSGLTPTGIDLGSRNFETYTHKKIAVVVGEGISSYEAGEVWHLFDQRVEHGVSLVDINSLSSSRLSKYDVLVMVNSYGSVNDRLKSALSDFVRGGGTLVATKNAVSSLGRAGLIPIKPVDDVPLADITSDFPPYANYSRVRGAQVTGGTIFKADLDLTHPINYGLKRTQMPIFRNHNNVFELHENPYGSPVRYLSEPLVAGYVSEHNLDRIANSAAVNVYSSGAGKVVAFVDNPNFRAYWWGTNRLFINAILFGDLINSSTTR